MKTIELQLYKFDELSEDAQEYAISNYRNKGQYHWIDEGIDSIKAFCDHFGVNLKNYSISPYAHSFIDTDAENYHFRGKKLKEFSRDHMPTGYCVDCDLWITFYDHFKKSGDALAAFNEAIQAGLKAIINDMEYQDSKEYISEHLIANEYDFLESGNRY